MQTNDRRKTFTTPAEFIVWALGSPHRVATDKHGHKYYMLISTGNGACQSWRLTKGAEAGEFFLIMNHNCPLVAVEDEHGVILEPPQRPDAESNATKYWDKKSVGLIIALIDERIAAATVERFALWEYEKKWSRDCDYRLKPKGES